MKKSIKALLLLLASLSLGACAPTPPDGDSVKMLARIEALEEKIEVTVLESEYTSGPHLVILSDKTEIFSTDEKNVTRDALSVGDTVEITYNGQVMLSYPPQIVAHKIRILATA